MDSPTPSRSLRPLIIRCLCVFIAFFGTVAIYQAATKPPKYQVKYRTIAHRFMDLEGQYVEVPDESYQLLDSIIASVKARTHYDPALTNPVLREQQIRQMFCTIDSVLTENNFIFPPGKFTFTLGGAFEEHDLSTTEMQQALALFENGWRSDQMKSHADQSFHLSSCVPNAFLYMGVAEALGLELKLVALPEHVFVRALLDKNHWINWEPAEGQSISNEQYVRDAGVQDWQIREGIYMCPLSAAQIEAKMCSCIAIRMGRTDQSIELYRKAIQLNSLDYYASNNLPLCLLFQAEPSAKAVKESAECAERGSRLDPNRSLTHQTQAFVFASEGQTAAATAEMNKAVDLDPKNIDARDLLPLIASGHSMFSAYGARHPIPFWICYEHGWLYLLAITLVACVAGVSYRIRRMLNIRSADAVIAVG